MSMTGRGAFPVQSSIWTVSLLCSKIRLCRTWLTLVALAHDPFSLKRCGLSYKTVEALLPGRKGDPVFSTLHGGNVDLKSEESKRASKPLIKSSVV